MPHFGVLLLGAVVSTWNVSLQSLFQIASFLDGVFKGSTLDISKACFLVDNPGLPHGPGFGSFVLPVVLSGWLSPFFGRVWHVWWTNKDLSYFSCSPWQKQLKKEAVCWSTEFECCHSEGGMVDLSGRWMPLLSMFSCSVQDLVHQCHPHSGWVSLLSLPENTLVDRPEGMMILNALRFTVKTTITTIHSDWVRNAFEKEDV